MRFVPFLLAAPLGAWAAAISSPDVETAGDVDNSTQAAKTFSLGEVENLDYRGGDAPAEFLKAHTKFVQTLPPWLAKAVESNPDLNRKFNVYLQKDKGQVGTVSASPPPFYDIQYVVPVDLGKPAQRTFLNLDTGSSDLWTFSSDTYEPHVRGQTLYKPKDSKMSKLQNGQSWSIRYGDGASASGIVYKDRVALGDTHFDEQAVQSAVDVSYAIAQDSFSSGIIGMAFSQANTVRPTKQKTYFENIKDQLAEPLFTVNLQKGRPGNYNFGYVNKAEYSGEITYAPIDNNGPFWKVNVAGYQVGSGGPFKAASWKAIVDTGTTLLLVPEIIIQDYYGSIPGSRYDPFIGMMVVPCNAQLPDFIFGIGNYRGTVPGHYINYGKSKGDECYGGIQSSDGIGMAIIGDVLLKAQFVVFNIETRKVGFANKPTLPPGQ